MTLLSSLALLASSAGCRQIIESLETQEVAVALMVATPDMPHPVTQQTIAGLTSLVVVYGELDAGRTNEANRGYHPIAGARVRLTFTHPTDGARELVATDVGDGTYTLDSTAEPRLRYAQVDYTLRIEHGGETYVMKVRPPAPSDIAEIAAEPDRVIGDHPAGQPLTITRSNPRGADDNDVAFATLSALESTTSSLTWTNTPDDGAGLVDLLLADDAWRADAFTIPGAELARGVYSVTLTPLARGFQLTGGAGGPPLFPGSSFLAGIGAGGGVVVP
ncbi:MAG: hypothetical protein IT385_20345 [Deltaproteobacteria bacterium]|nr:hypothetical protein [Deltaproteobacteria bacterium]